MENDQQTATQHRLIGEHKLEFPVERKRRSEGMQNMRKIRRAFRVHSKCIQRVFKTHSECNVISMLPISVLPNRHVLGNDLVYSQFVDPLPFSNPG